MIDWTTDWLVPKYNSHTPTTSSSFCGHSLEALVSRRINIPSPLLLWSSHGCHRLWSVCLSLWAFISFSPHLVKDGRTDRTASCLDDTRNKIALNGANLLTVQRRNDIHRPYHKHRSSPASQRNYIGFMSSSCCPCHININIIVPMVDNMTISVSVGEAVAAPVLVVVGGGGFWVVQWQTSDCDELWARI